MKKLHDLVHRLHNPDMGILFLRLALGLVFVNAGWMKMQDMEMVAGFFGQMGIPAALAYVATYVELIGGVLLLVGIFARYAGILLAITMLVATFLMRGNGFSLANGGFEYSLVLLLGSMAMVTFGAGKYSLAGWLKKRK